MKRKIIALLLAFAFVCGLPATAAKFTDTVGMPYSRDVDFLNALGIVDGRTSTQYAGEDTLTRAELVLILLRTLGSDIGGSNEVIFDDVDENHWAIAEIGYAYSMGMVNGVSERLFAPDEPATFNQTVKMTVALLGYDFMAKEKGGYPNGYLYVANNLKLITNTFTYGENPITRGDMAIIIANALETEIADTYAVGKGETGIEVHMQKGEYLMSRYLGVKKLEERVNAHYYGSVSGKIPEQTDEVIIGETLLKTGEVDVLKSLGEDVVAYVKDEENGSVPTLLFMERASSTKVTEFTADAVESVTNDKITYTAEDKERSINISDADLYVNGLEASSLTGVNLSNATYKLIENRGHDDILLVDAYTNATVKSASANLEMLYMEGKTPVDLEDYDRFILKNTEGKDITLSDVKPWNIVSYRDINRNGEKIFYGIVSNFSAEGELTIKGDAGNYTELYIDETPYKVSADLFGTIPTLGTKIKIYTDYLGHIAAIDDDITGYTYGYLVAAGRESTFANMQFKIFTHTGEMKLFTAKDKVEFNGTKTEEKDLDSKTDIFPGGDGKNATRQLIRYELSGSGELKSLDTAAADVIAPDNRETFGRNFYADEKAEGRWTRTFASRYIIDDNTVYFIVPDPAEEAEDDDFEIYTKTFTTGDTFVYPAYFYDIDEDNVIGAICKEVSSATGNTLDMDNDDIVYGVVTKKKYASRDGESYPVVSITNTLLSENKDIFIDEKESIKMTVRDDSIQDQHGNDKPLPNWANVTITNSSDPYYDKAEIPFADVNIGDIMMMRVNKAGIAIDSRVLIRADYHDYWESLYEDNSQVNYAQSDYRWLRTTVKHVSDKGAIGEVKIYMKPDGVTTLPDGTTPAKNSTYEIIDAGIERMVIRCDNVLIYDSSIGKVIDGTWEDIQDGDRIGVLCRVYRPVMVVVYR